jgi:LPS sulfotransferase NodH
MNETAGRILEQAGAMPALSYVVCSTPRSGSTFLCERLMASGVAGLPSEWTLASNERLAKEMLGIGASFADPGFLVELLTKARTANGVFGLKLMWPQMAQLLGGELWNLRLGPPEAGTITLPNAHYVRTTRRDRVRQAVSFLIAQRTNRWQRLATDDHPLVAAARRSGFETDDRAPPGWLLADIQARLAIPSRRSALFAELDACLTEIDWQTAEWNRFFAEQAIVPFDVEYEELAADPAAVMGGILRFLGLDAPNLAGLPRSWLRPMSDERNEALVAAYRRSRAGVKVPS